MPTPKYVYHFVGQQCKTTLFSLIRDLQKSPRRAAPRRGELWLLRGAQAITRRARYRQRRDRPILVMHY